MHRVSIPKLHSIKWKTGPFAENIIHVNMTEERKDVPVINVLMGAAEENLYDIVIFGYNKHNEEFIATSTSNIQRAAYMFARGQLVMLRDAD